MESESIISFEVLNSIYDYLYHQNNQLELKINGIKGSVGVYLYGIPFTFTDDKSKSEMAELGYQNSYQVLNKLYEKMGIGPVSDELIAQDYACEFIHFQFDADSTTSMKKYGKKQFPQTFFVFFCCENSTEINSFRILHTNSYLIYFIKSLLESTCIDFRNPGAKLIDEVETEERYAIRSELERIGVKAFELVLHGICQQLKINVPSQIQLTTIPDLIPERVTAATLEEYLTLITRDNIEETTIKSEAKKLFSIYKKRLKIDEENHDAFYENYFDFSLLADIWESDWKFDAEEAEYSISKLLDSAFTFSHPTDTYSADLLPYIQAELAKQDLAMMSFDTLGDSYAFFIVNKKDVGRIVQLADLINIKIDAFDES